MKDYTINLVDVPEVTTRKNRREAIFKVIMVGRFFFFSLGHKRLSCCLIKNINYRGNNKEENWISCSAHFDCG